MQEQLSAPLDHGAYTLSNRAGKLRFDRLLARSQLMADVLRILPAKIEQPNLTSLERSGRCIIRLPSSQQCLLAESAFIITD